MDHGFSGVLKPPRGHEQRIHDGIPSSVMLIKRDPHLPALPTSWRKEVRFRRRKVRKNVNAIDMAHSDMNKRRLEPLRSPAQGEARLKDP
jgi:hypothetical protein